MLLSKLISIILGKSSDLCIVPSVWKCANIIPVLKRKGEIRMSHYRPISLLRTFSVAIRYGCC